MSEQQASIELPPDDKMGNDTPVSGNTFKEPPRFSAACANRTEAQPLCKTSKNGERPEFLAGDNSNKMSAASSNRPKPTPKILLGSRAAKSLLEHVTQVDRR